MEPSLNSTTDRALPLLINEAILRTATTAALRGELSEPPPPAWVTGRLMSLVHSFGRSSLLLPDESLHQLFAGVNLRRYREIRDLYISRPPRTWRQVFTILERQQEQARAEPIKAEAVWALCIYHHDLQRQANRLRVSRVEYWAICDESLPSLKTPGQRVHYVAQFLNTRLSKILALSISHGPLDIEQLLYAALQLSRRPAGPEDATLEWALPVDLYLDQSPSPQVIRFCRLLDVELVKRPPPETLAAALTVRSRKARASLHGGLLSGPLVLDRIVEIALGHSPLTLAEDNQRRYRRSVTQAREPLEIFPDLLTLLPQVSTPVNVKGQIILRELHYESDILALWAGELVHCRFDSDYEACIWVYTNEGFLCQAWARELRRRDGSYRRSRPGKESFYDFNHDS